MSFVPPVAIKGLKEFQRGLKQVDGELAKELRKSFNEVAGVVVDDVRRRVPVDTGAARKSVRAASTQKAAVVKAGGRKAPYYPWLDFGGRVGRDRSIRRAFIPGGRYLYPSFKRHRDDLADAAGDVVVKLFKKAGWDA